MKQGEGDFPKVNGVSQVKSAWEVPGESRALSLVVSERSLGRVGFIARRDERAMRGRRRSAPGGRAIARLEVAPLPAHVVTRRGHHDHRAVAAEGAGPRDDVGAADALDRAAVRGDVAAVLDVVELVVERDVRAPRHAERQGEGADHAAAARVEAVGLDVRPAPEVVELHGDEVGASRLHGVLVGVLEGPHAHSGHAALAGAAAVAAAPAVADVGLGVRRAGRGGVDAGAGAAHLALGAGVAAGAAVLGAGLQVAARAVAVHLARGAGGPGGDADAAPADLAGAAGEAAAAAVGAVAREVAAGAAAVHEALAAGDGLAVVDRRGGGVALGGAAVSRRLLVADVGAAGGEADGGRGEESEGGGGAEDLLHGVTPSCETGVGGDQWA